MIFIFNQVNTNTIFKKKILKKNLFVTDSFFYMKIILILFIKLLII